MNIIPPSTFCRSLCSCETFCSVGQLMGSTKYSILVPVSTIQGRAFFFLITSPVTTQQSTSALRPPATRRRRINRTPRTAYTQHGVARPEWTKNHTAPPRHKACMVATRARAGNEPGRRHRDSSKTRTRRVQETDGRRCVLSS